MSYDGRVRADARQLPLQDECVQCCVTSPPYWGLRDYSMCSCRKGRVQHASSTMAGSQAGTPSEFSEPDPDCLKCNGSGHDLALRNSQIGLEATPQAYVESMVGVFREVRRVLKDDGVLWLNLGDTYAADRGGTAMPAETLAGGISGRGDEIAKRGRGDGFRSHRDPASHGLKHKDLIGIPWRVALALQADGWYLRSDNIWHKPNPMPESVKDRPTRAHEYLFLLAKAERYYYDGEAIREPATKDRNAGTPKERRRFRPILRIQRERR